VNKKREIAPKLNYINEKGRTRKVLVVIPVHRGKWVYYLDPSRTRRESIGQIIAVINRRRGMDVDQPFPKSWGLETDEDHYHLFSCSERSFFKWFGSGTVEKVDVPVDISIESPSEDAPSAVMAERERCIQLVEYRCRRLLRVIKDYPPGHNTHGKIAASIENLRAVGKWIADGKIPKETTGMNPGGEA
jgi:hypothetical protein